MKLLVASALSLILVLAVIWIVGAWKAGYFLRDRRPPVSLPGEASMDAFSKHKRYVQVGPWNVAYIDEGSGPPVLLLHGCPFHAYEWKDVLPDLARHHRVIAPDLLGLGDTVVRLDDDYRLPNQVRMVVGLLDALGLREVHIVGHDHGGATTELLMNSAPDRLRSVVLTNVEAYDQWPSEPERPAVAKVVSPVWSPVLRLAFGAPAVQRQLFRMAVYDSKTLTDQVLAAYVRPHIASPARWARLRRFFGWQLDREHNLETLHAVDGLRRFTGPTLILWGRHDTNFGPPIAERLARDIPGVVRTEWLEHSAHLPMQEEPAAYAASLLRFFDEVEQKEAKREEGFAS
jgi:pimeloyl-ACP methyl ester carboxylesterase